MADAVTRSILITGANAGIGKELARQLGSRPEVDRVVLACRNPGRAESARAELEAATRRAIFEVAILDTSDLVSVRSAACSLSQPVDALVMNAGGTGGPHPAALTASGATQLFAVNVLGHVALLDTLIEQRKLKKAAVLTGSEAARGVPKLLIKRPSFTHTSVDELVNAIDGNYYAGKTFDAPGAYAQAKYIGALWIGALARKHPDLRFVTISPGGTSGTETAKSMPTLQRLAFKRIVMGRIGRRLGLSHPLRDGAGRLTLAVTDPAYRNGTFYASRANTLTGPVVDQATIFSDLANTTFQDNAHEAIHRFLPRQPRNPTGAHTS
jgi:NAD(P)-dependent dehydrogenase (short-subunit alcohol dehydrogenase family)